MSKERDRRLHGHEGRGLLFAATTGARDVINAAAPLIMAAVDRMPRNDRAVPSAAPTSAAPTAAPPSTMWRRVLAHQRAREPARPIEIVYTDLPRNDFSQLFRTDPRSDRHEELLRRDHGVYPFASGTSFHEGIFPDDSLDLAFSATASHYISKVPGNISNHVHMVGRRRRGTTRYEEPGRSNGTSSSHCGRASWRRAACSCSSISASTRGPLSRPHRRGEHVRHLQRAVARAWR